MQKHKMGTDDHHQSDKGVVRNGPSNNTGGWKSLRRRILQSTPKGSRIKTVQEAENDEQELNKRSSRIQHVSEMLKYWTGSSKQQPTATHALNGLKFISKSDDPSPRITLEKQFDELTKETGGLLPRSSFAKCIGMNKESKEFAEDLFDSLCRWRDLPCDKINKAQLMEFWTEISNDSFDSRLPIFLHMVDKDGDGKITKEELIKIIQVSASVNKLSTIKNRAETFADMIMEKLDPDNRGSIMIEKLGKLLRDAAANKEKREKESLSKSSLQQPKPTQSPPIGKRYEHLKYFLHDNWKRSWVIILWIGTMAGLFTWKYIQYKNREVYDVLGSCVCIAKGSAETLKLNMAIILLPVCRRTITWLRNNSKLGVAVPFDDNINFHQVIAVVIAIGVGLHAVSHVGCNFPRLIHATEEEYKPIQQFLGDQAKNYWHFVKEVDGYTGITMVVLMLIAFTLATPWLRRRKGSCPPPQSEHAASAHRHLLRNVREKLTGFNAFWYSHHLFVIVYVMLILHVKEWYKKTTWMYLAVPMLIYTCERLITKFRYRDDGAELQKVFVYSKNALALQMTKPHDFDYKSGQYMFVKYDDISPYEWHPFSITSAPSDNFLSVHIRDLGDWTKEINRSFRDETKYKLQKEGIDFTKGDQIVPKVKIDGPYGAPAEDYKKYEVVLLVGLGIGATPMISIVKDIVNNMKGKKENALVNDAILQKSKSGHTSANAFRTKRAYFYWVTKEQESFDWFKGVMDEVAGMDTKGVIEMHNHCTSVFEEGDARSAIITMLQSLNHDKTGVDVVSGTRVKSYFAKPNWRDVYSRIAANHTGSEIGVFYCGTPAAIKEQKQAALDYSDPSTSTTFVFHKENF